MKLETMMVKTEDSPEGVLINKSDFNPEIHEDMTPVSEKTKAPRKAEAQTSN